MYEITNNLPDPSSSATRDIEVLAAIRADVETELAHLETSEDLPNDDEPGRELLATRLRTLRDATSSLEVWRRNR